MLLELFKRRVGLVRPRCYTVSGQSFEPVLNNLAVTPSDMHQMTARGIPISGQNEALFYDGTLNATFDVPIEERRGIDVNAVWESEMDARRKFHSANANDVSNYGE